MRKLVWIINAAEVVKTVKAGKKLQGVIAWDDKHVAVSYRLWQSDRDSPVLQCHWTFS